MLKGVHIHSVFTIPEEFKKLFYKKDNYEKYLKMGHVNLLIICITKNKISNMVKNRL